MHTYCSGAATVMLNRTKLLVELARKEAKNQENDQNLINIRRPFEHIESTTPINIFDEALSPEDVEQLINNAEIVFVDNNAIDNCLDPHVTNDRSVDPHVTNDRSEADVILEKQALLRVGDSNEDPTSEIAFQIAEENVDLDIGTILQNPETMEDGSHLEKMSVSTENLNTAVEGPEELEITEVTNSEIDNSGDYQPQEDSSNEAASDSSSEGRNYKKRKIAKGQNKRHLNKKLRMSGQNYLGFRKPRNQKNTFHDTPREERQLKPRCTCKKTLSKKCSEISEQNRATIFSKFWSQMNWDQRRTFVANTVRTGERKRPIETESRRSITLRYNLVVNNVPVPVCKRMYLNTLSLGEWSVRSWAMKAEEGISSSTDLEVALRPKRKDIFEGDRNFLKLFLTELNKLPSHYCRKTTDRLYLEQIFQSWVDVYKIYEKRCEEESHKVLSLKLLKNIANQMKISLFQPRKDQCDICFMYKNGNFEKENYEKHISKKNLARSEKEKDKEKALKGECHLITMDVQAVKLSPQIPASALYYKTKLCCHNFTLYDLVTKKVVCYWFNETEADGQASTYASFLVEYLEGEFLNNDKLSIIIYSDGCTAQNRNAILSNALLYLADKYKVLIVQKFLEKGHTQMECDSVHSVIETRLKNKEIYLPSDYLKITQEARRTQPYEARNRNFDFFRNFGEKSLMKYKSIRPTRTSDSNNLVTDIRALKYKDGKISYKVDFSEDFQEIPIRPIKVDFESVIFPPLYNARNPITKTKFDHLQAIKKCLPRDCWDFYDLLPYNTKEK